ncbi:polyprenyl synthetase family protein [Rubrivivax gelatinosus]|uniref:polyprenyl synthetase family protein n=1 Tax=Rubrivivax gelatinosus TaxID=28068 RepID=UPI0002ECA7B5|nr:polyprenyl synthetase family protein [Rubrivivax gelatinosus]MBG6078631.1 geranylgeranyl diphosphate synthase type II [Rubrivivax gelatinosus]
MNTMTRIEQALEAALVANEGAGCPPKLAAAIRHAVFPGGARIRPQLCIAVAMANGDTDPALADAAASAIELIHCASLVHDDLPCFDDAPTRRGQPSVHKAYGERLAVLAGDALIVTAFQTLGAAGGRHPQRMAHVLQTVARGVGTPLGIIAGQAWECEPRVALSDYQRAKTGALFAAATAAGAQASGGDGETWRALGDWLGEAYQVADDVRDALADPEQLGKPVGRDVALGRPSAAIQHGLVGAVEHFERLVQGAIDAIPDCKGAGMLRQIVRMEAERLVPKAWCANIEALAERAAVRAAERSAAPTQAA